MRVSNDRLDQLIKQLDDMVLSGCPGGDDWIILRDVAHDLKEARAEIERRDLAAITLSMYQARVLRNMVRAGGSLTANKVLGSPASPGRTNAYLRQLEAKGLVTRGNDRVERSYIWHVTELGRRVNARPVAW